MSGGLSARAEISYRAGVCTGENVATCAPCSPVAPLLRCWRSPKLLPLHPLQYSDTRDRYVTDIVVSKMQSRKEEFSSDSVMGRACSGV